MKVLTPVAVKASLQLRDFKDRRTPKLRRSFAAIAGLHQAAADRRLQSKFEARVAANVARRKAARSQTAMPSYIGDDSVRVDENDPLFLPVYLRMRVAQAQ